MNSRIVAVAWITLALSGGTGAGVPEIDSPRGDAAASPNRSDATKSVEGSGPVDGTARDARELCARLAGAEREICLKQAREHSERARAPGIGGTPGRGSGSAGRESGPESR
jgi:hypothetical protein